jgi:HAAS domain-containing protein
VISDYLDSLGRALGFDRSLSACVRQEVEDHLREAVAADPLDDGIEAERRAIAKFGDPRVIAAQFAVISLAKQTRRAGAVVVLVVAAVFVLMKARLAWYGATQWAMSDDMRAVGGVVSLIDRYSFCLSVIVGIGGWAYVSGGRIPLAFYPAYRKRLSRFLLLCTAATGTLVVSVISALRLLGTELSADFVVPILSMAVEIACAGILVVQVRTITQRRTSTTALLGT